MPIVINNFIFKHISWCISQQGRVSYLLNFLSDRLTASFEYKQGRRPSGQQGREKMLGKIQHFVGQKSTSSISICLYRHIQQPLMLHSFLLFVSASFINQGCLRKKHDWSEQFQRDLGSLGGALSTCLVTAKLS